MYVSLYVYHVCDSACTSRSLVGNGSLTRIGSSVISWLLYVDPVCVRVCVRVFTCLIGISFHLQVDCLSVRTWIVTNPHHWILEILI